MSGLGSVDAVEVARRACVDVRSVWKWMAGGVVRGKAGERIQAVLAEMAKEEAK